MTERALDGESLTIKGELPLLGVSIAWPSALDRDKKPVGDALKDAGWLNVPINQKVASRLGLASERSHALNDVNAAAISIAFDRTREPDHDDAKHAHLTAVLRLAGGVGGATVVIEPHDEHRSGFIKSILLGGVDSLAGEIGHIEVPQEVIEMVNHDLPAGLKPAHPVYCSCIKPGKEGEVPSHLEAFVSANAAAARMGDDVTMAQAIASLREDSTAPVNARIIQDTARVLGRTLMSPIAWLNPAEIVLTGSMALPELRVILTETIADAHAAVTRPAITVLEGEENDLVRARGAALVVIRHHVYKKFEDLLSSNDPNVLTRKVSRLTQRLKRPLG